MPETMIVSQPGFSDAVSQSQEIFRTVLTALSKPGRILSVRAVPEAKLGIDPAALAILLTLADGDTPVWIGGETDTALAAYLRFHTGAPIVGNAGDAQFALIADVARFRSLQLFNPGTEDFPDRSATVILGVRGLAETGELTLRGPGIPDQRTLGVAGMPPRFVADWAENHAQFPCGIDLILSCGAQLAGLPRSIALEASCMSQ
jgi:alpha-D-ribose 1-methylphosphonate 5-triphosphate synthase subunit PhnH